MTIGDVIDSKYTIIDKLGQGGMGMVFKVSNGSSEFALKICTDTDEESKKRFNREVRLMKKITDDNVIQVLEFEPDHTPPYFTMPLCRYSLASQILTLKDDHPSAIRLLIEMCKGIAAIHKAGGIHRDIKPQNALIGFDDVIKVSDLGLGKFIDRDTTTITDSLDVMGTPYFMPPEYSNRSGTKDAGVPGDIYQLGKTIYNVLTGRSPMHIDATALPGGLFYIVRIATDGEPDKRYKSAEELTEALENYLTSLDTSKDPETVFKGYMEKVKELRYAAGDDGFKLFVPILLGYKDEPDKFFKLFHRISRGQLRRLAANDSALMAAVFEVYVPVIETYLEGHSKEYEDADEIATAMEAIFNGTKDVNVRVDALRIALKAAVKKNRYDAMDTFLGMLEMVKDKGEATAVSEMLRRNKDDLAWLNDRKPDAKFHYLIDEVRKSVK